MKNDLISRRALCEYALNQKDKSVSPNDIMRFPSAQPDTTTHDSIPAETGKNDSNGPSGDTISRQQAIEALENTKEVAR